VRKEKENELSLGMPGLIPGWVVDLRRAAALQHVSVRHYEEQDVPDTISSGSISQG
jgi:hypothetical protein